MKLAAGEILRIESPRGLEAKGAVRLTISRLAQA